MPNYVFLCFCYLKDLAVNILGILAYLSRQYYLCYASTYKRSSMLEQFEARVDDELVSELYGKDDKVCVLLRRVINQIPCQLLFFIDAM